MGKDNRQRKRGKKCAEGRIRPYIMMLLCNREGQTYCLRGKKNPPWNDCSSQHQHNPLGGAQEQRQEHRMNKKIKKKSGS